MENNMIFKRSMMIQEFFRYQPLLGELVQRDIKVRYRHSFLGMLWTILNPLLMMAVLTIAFSNIFEMNIDNFPVYVLIGQIIFNCNAEATTTGMNAILWNASLLKKVYIPKYLLPLSNVLSSMVNFGFSFIALIIVMVVTGAPFHSSMLLLWIPLCYLLLFSFGLTLVLCTVNVFFRDTQHLYSVFITAWMYLSAIFYPPDIVPGNFRIFIEWNPLYQFIIFFREIILEGQFPNLEMNILCLIIASVSAIMGMCIFAKMQDHFILHI